MNYKGKALRKPCLRPISFFMLMQWAVASCPYLFVLALSAVHSHPTASHPGARHHAVSLEMHGSQVEVVFHHHEVGHLHQHIHQGEHDHKDHHQGGHHDDHDDHHVLVSLVDAQTRTTFDVPKPKPLFINFQQSIVHLPLVSQALREHPRISSAYLWPPPTYSPSTTTVLII